MAINDNDNDNDNDNNQDGQKRIGIMAHLCFLLAMHQMGILRCFDLLDWLSDCGFGDLTTQPFTFHHQATHILSVCG